MSATALLENTLTKQVIYYSAAVCGSGKTTWAVEHMGRTKGRYIYCVDRIDEFPIRTNLIMTAAYSANLVPAVYALSSRDRSVVVGRDFPIAVESMSDRDHAVIIITHEAMKLVDHSIVEGLGWSIIVDEDPKIWISADLNLSASRPFWEANYTLEDMADGYSVISATADAPGWTRLSHDDLTTPIAAFHSRVLRGGVVVNLTDWADLDARQKMSYFTIWDVSELRHYDFTMIMANSFDSLVTFRLIQSLHPDIDLKSHITLARASEWAKRKLKINYVADDHVAGNSWFNREGEGKKAVEKWKAWVSDSVDRDRHYSAANITHGNLRLPGVQVSPKIAGSNKYRDLTQCSVLYSAKASGPEERIFAKLTGGLIDAEAVRRDREFEDLIQIVFRSSLRQRDDTRDVVVNVYDREQAEFLELYFTEAGFPFEVEVEFHDLNLKRVQAKPGPKPDPLNPPKTAAERQRARRERKKAEAEAGR